MADAILTQKRLRELVSYCPDTGIFHDSISGKQISGYDSKGYRRLWLDGRNYMMHRLAWLYVYGRWPRAMIDHINGDPRDNRIVNLRDVTNAVNQQNQRAARIDNKLGLLGVSFEKWSGKYKAQIRANGKKLLIGRFDCPLIAHKAYLEAKRSLHDGCTI